MPAVVRGLRPAAVPVSVKSSAVSSATLAVDAPFELPKPWGLRVKFAGAYAPGLQALLQPNGDFKAKPQTGTVDIDGSVLLVAERAGGPMQLIGLPGGTRLEVGKVSGGIALKAALDPAAGTHRREQRRFVVGQIVEIGVPELMAVRDPSPERHRLEERFVRAVAPDEHHARREDVVRPCGRRFVPLDRCGPRAVELLPGFEPRRFPPGAHAVDRR